MQLSIYLAGQIHSDWRASFRAACEAAGLDIIFCGPMENHDRSDDIGEEILGIQPGPVYKDEAASSFNNLRTRLMIGKADMVIALFGEKYKQWNTAMDAGIAIGLNKPLLLIRDASLHHALKELSNYAQATVETPQQAVQALSYIFASK